MVYVDKPESDDAQSELEVAEATATKPWQPYLEAALGFRNHCSIVARRSPCGPSAIRSTRSPAGITDLLTA
jgi:hypothetical protein